MLGTLAGLNLPAMGVNPRHKDILLEFDWIEDQSEAGAVAGSTCPANAIHSHKPTQAMLDIVIVMFGAAPVSNPDGIPGIKVIADTGQGGPFAGGNLVPDADGIVQGIVFDADYVAKYEANFAQNRRGFFHYVLMAHRYNNGGFTDSSGYAEIYGSLYIDSMMVTLACGATMTRVGNTIAHELGHNLRLHHGGDKTNACNQKPNYNSIMNYRFQFDGVDNDCQYGHPSGNPADFSQGTRLPLNEAALSEATGMCAGIPVDFNGNGDSSQVLVNWDLNSYSSQVTECGGEFTVLTDYNDWANLVLPISLPNGGGDGPDVEPLGTDCPSPRRTPERSIRHANFLPFGRIELGVVALRNV